MLLGSRFGGSKTLCTINKQLFSTIEKQICSGVAVLNLKQNIAYRIAGNFRGQADFHEILTQAWNAVQATRLNEICTHENHRFPDKRIYPTKITRYTVY